MKKRELWFMAPDDGAGGGGALDLLGDVSTESNDSAPTESVEDTPPAGDEPSASSNFDPKAFAEQFGKSFGESVATKLQPKAEPDKKLSDDEARKLLNVWTPTKEWLAKYDNLETREQALAEHRDGLIRQADTIAQIRMQQIRQELESRFSPMMEHFQRMEVQAQTERFAKTYPELGDPKMATLVGAVAQSIIKEGKQYDSESAVFKEIATRAAAVIQQINPDFKLSTGGSSASSKKSSSTIPVTTPGGGGGGGTGTRSSSAAPKGNKALAILGPVGGG